MGLKILNCDCFEDQLAVYEKLPEPKRRRGFGGDEVREGFVLKQEGCAVRAEKRSVVLKDALSSGMLGWKIEEYKAKQKRKNLN